MLCGVVTLGIVSFIEQASPIIFARNCLSWLLAVEVLGVMAFAVSSSCSKTMTAVALSLLMALLAMGGSGWILANLFHAKPIWQVLAFLNLTAIGLWFWCYALLNVETLWNSEPAT